MDEEEAPVGAIHRNFDRRSTQFQSKASGTIIKSQRKFGIEVEMFHTITKSVVQLSSTVARVFGIEHDGSIEAAGGIGVEVVSPIMRGDAGENAVVDLFRIINSLKFSINKTCGLHVHLDGTGFAKTHQTLVVPIESVTDESVLTKLSEENGDYAFVVRSDVMQELCNRLSAEEAAQLVSDEYLSVDGNQLFLNKELGYGIREIRMRSGVLDIGKSRSLIDIFGFVEESEQSTATNEVKVDMLSPRPIDYLCIVYGNRNLHNVLTLLYLHSVFGDVFASMLPKSRRQDNLYCQNLALGFSAGEIENIHTFTELENAWYKTKKISEVRNHKNNRYDDSRYFAVNLHSLFAKYGTVEIRSHSATLDPNKVLYWVAFHQEILDNIVNGHLSIPILREGASLSSLEDKTAFLMDVMGLRSPLLKYMQQRIDYFKNNENK